ncbi:MAG TPA: hypothetical protein VGG14_14865 [Candidatus Sulfotelmatobacter sp.]|jgi:hypothetical protein
MGGAKSKLDHGPFVSATTQGSLYQGATSVVSRKMPKTSRFSRQREKPPAAKADAFFAANGIAKAMP